MERRLTRRAVLVGAGGAVAAIAVGGVLVDRGTLPGRLIVRRALGACDVGGPLPAVEPGAVDTGTLVSAARGREVGVTTVHPPGADGPARLPICLYLHGRGGDHLDVAREDIGLPWLLADAVAGGVPPFALVGVEGGSGYWHARASGDDAGALLVDELLPELARRGYAVDRIGLLGASMGGYGALLHAQRIGPERVAAVGAMSPALWQRYEDAAPGAFDSAEDFAAHDVFAGRPALAGIPVSIGTGSDDPFAAATRAFLDGAPPETTGAIADGCHDAAFWRWLAPSQLAPIGAALAG